MQLLARCRRPPRSLQRLVPGGRGGRGERANVDDGVKGVQGGVRLLAQNTHPFALGNAFHHLSIIIMIVDNFINFI